MKRISVAREHSGGRLDLWLETILPDLSRSRIQTLIRSGHITLDGRPAKPHATVRGGMTASVDIPAAVPVPLAPEAVSLSILYEDSDIIVVNKPAGMVVHPAAGHAAGTLVNALLHHCSDLGGVGGERRPGIVHRLDKDTSGAIVAAKNDRAMLGLVRQFKAGRVTKEYLALVAGIPSPPAGTIESLIGRSPHDRKKMSARPHTGRRAVTHYEVQEALVDASLLRIRIETGRTHQIRVHMAHMRHPVLGDRQYGGRQAAPRAPRQMLHARRLAFEHPLTRKAVECTAPIPDDMLHVLEALRQIGDGKGHLTIQRGLRPQHKRSELRGRRSGISPAL